jgi:hypothetical protein
LVYIVLQGSKKATKKLVAIMLLCIFGLTNYSIYEYAAKTKTPGL